MTATDRAALLKQLRGAGRIWCYASGYYDRDTPSLAAMQQLTGFQFKIITPSRGWATPTAVGLKLGLSPEGFGMNEPLRPSFAVTDATPDETLATYPDGSAAIAMRKTPDGVSIYCGVAEISSDLVRIAAKASGVHLFTTTDATIFANGPYVAVHADKPGPLTIDTSSKAPVMDVMTGKSVGNGPSITLPFALGETRVFRY